MRGTDLFELRGESGLALYELVALTRHLRQLSIEVRLPLRQCFRRRRERDLVTLLCIAERRVCGGELTLERIARVLDVGELRRQLGLAPCQTFVTFLELGRR